MSGEQLRQGAKVVAAHVGAVTAMNLITTVFLHRGETHGTIEVGRPVREVARFGTWILSGMKPREWVVVHRRHHEHTDEEGDPHSPVNEGRFGVLKVLTGNGLVYYRQAAKEIKEEEIPEHLKPDKMDKLLYDKGWLGLTGLFALFTLLHKGNKNKGALSLAAHSWLAHGVFFLSGGGFVNALLHRGRGNVIKTLFNKPEPFADGTYTVNSPLAAIVTLGEGWHNTHHDNQKQLRFHQNPWFDMGGVTGELLIKLGLAKKGNGPRK